MRFLLLLYCVVLNLVLVAQGMKASFSSSLNRVCVGNQVSFTNSSSAGNSPIVSSTWDFGDGQVQNSSGTSGISHAYAKPGKYNVTLVVIAASGITAASGQTTFVEVFDFPKASFDIGGNFCQLPAEVIPTNTSVTASGNTYNWNFGNGVSSAEASPQKVTYTSTGTFTISLTISNSGPGCSSTFSKKVTIHDYLGSITGNSEKCANDVVQLVGRANKKVDNYSWNFGNGVGSGENNDTVKYAYPKPKNAYVASLTITNNEIGCQHTSFFKVNVLPLPNPGIAVNQKKVCPNFPVQFSTNAPGGSNFSWSFGDGQSYSGKNPPPHTYTSEGKFSVTLSQKGSNGCSGSTTVNQIVEVFNPKALFESDTAGGCTPLAVKFIDQSTTPDEENPIVEWNWDFGNGAKSNGQFPPSQTYSTGKYDVTLSIKSKKGCVVTNKSTAFIKVGHIDSVNFSVFPFAQCARQPIEFKDKSLIKASHTPDEVSYTWNYGDDKVETAFNPNHAYSKDTGYFDVKLTVNFRGCIDSIRKLKAIYNKPPLAIFKPDSLLFCNPATLPIYNKMIDLAKSGRKNHQVSVEWDYGNGTPNYLISKVNMEDPLLGTSELHPYYEYDTYKVRQTVVNQTTGCTDTTHRIFHVSKVVSDYTVQNDSVCRLSKLKFKEKSYGEPSKHALNSWVFESGDGGVVVGRDTNYIYRTASLKKEDFKLALITGNNVGCFHKVILDTITVLELPLAKSTTVNDVYVGCIGTQFKFLNKSKPQANGVALKSFEWDFTFDKSHYTSSSTIDTIVKVYDRMGLFSTVLKTIDVFGCKSFDDTVKILITKPSTDFKLDSVVCNKEVFKAINTTQGVGMQRFIWIVDDNYVGTSQDLTYDFSDQTSGLFVAHKIKLTSFDENDCSNNIEKLVKVSFPRAIIDYQLSSPVENNINEKGEYKCPPVISNYKNASTSIGKIDSVFWNFGIGKNSILIDPTTLYLFPGIYTTTLKCKDQFGCVSDTIMPNFLTILGPKGQPRWEWMGDVCYQKFRFIADSLENVSNLEWNMTDGTRIKDKLVATHRFKNIQSYGPTLILKDSEGCRVTYPMDTIILKDVGLEANFEASSLELKLGQNLHVVDKSFSKNKMDFWEWDFGDGFIQLNESNSSVNHRYSVGGMKDFVLTVMDRDSCYDQFFTRIKVEDDYDVPNVITPNFDGKNDLLVMFDKIYARYDIQVYNRWGNVIVDKKNQSDVLLWDGTDGDENICEEGVYFYVLKGILQNGSSLDKKGFVTLMKD